MHSQYFESINSRQFQDRIVLTKADALVKISSFSVDTNFLCSFLDRVAPLYQGKLKFFELDPVSDSGLCETYGVNNATAVLFFKKGTMVDKISGGTHRTILSTKIHRLFQS